VTNPKKVYVTDGAKKFVGSQNRLEMTASQEKVLHFDVKRAGPGTIQRPPSADAITNYGLLQAQAISVRDN